MPIFLIKPLIILCSIVGLFGFGYYKGYASAESDYNKAAIIQASKNAELLSQAISETESKTRLLYEAKIRHINKPLPDKCMLSTEFQVRHNYATGMPESATASTVTAKQVADTIIENYSNCRQNAIWLEECNRICR